ncbi:uncharacterized protein TNCT_651031 [Trichonephila clavata]|uniref:Uncharacterized protein n=1 Tax=Trichonephila clavata TaxID=2740835 RepID=A0A8X6L449_TRICU|nr:uncharacterized protein TNCT_651031 [Trichonephila clavata]
MRKNSGDHCNFCPDCANGNQNEEPVASPNPYEEDECCCCCCCSCSSAESETQELPVPPEETPASGRAVTEKKDILSNLSVVRTNREQASIQTLLQFVEAVVNCDNFLRQYYLKEDFCLECVQDSVSESNLRRTSNLNLNDSCSCRACEGNHSEASREPEPTELNCSDCSTPKRPTSNRIPNRRNRRRRRTRNSQFANSAPSNQYRMSKENSKPPSKVEPEDYDSDCSECQRDRRFDPQPSKVVERERCNCEGCIREAEANNRVNLNHDENGRTNIGNNECCGDCSCCSSSASNLEPCNIPNCKDCTTPQSNGSNSNENSCGSDCEECAHNQREDSACECCRNIDSKTDTAAEEKNENANNDMTASDSCDCEDCQCAIECSDELCEECGTNKPSKKDSKKK